MMNNLYPLAHIVHLFCAIAFVGGVIFEALVLSVLHGSAVSREARREVHTAISRRAVKVMPWIVFFLFVSGFLMLHRYTPLLHAPFSSAFTLQLTLKLVLAVSILGHFLIAVCKMHRQSLTTAWSKYIHRAVLLHMLLIVLLAKSMFYLA